MLARFTLSALAAPESARLHVGGEAWLKLVADPAGFDTIDAAQLKDGLLWLVAACIQGTGKVGSQLSVV